MSHVHQQQSFPHHQSPQRWTSPIRSSSNTAYGPVDARQRLNFGDRGEPSSPLSSHRPSSSPRPSVYQAASVQQPGFGRSVLSPPSSSPLSPGAPLRSESTYPTNSGVNQSVNLGSVPAASVMPNIEPNSIEYASKKIDEIMEKDTQHQSLYQSLISDQLTTGSRPVSGLLSHDYPPVIEKGLLTQNLFTIAHKTPVPVELNELLNQPDVGVCHMGLFPEICRAWMTIDSDLYLWDFRDGSDLSFYDGLKESIITMALVNVKKGVFQSPIRHLLVITTVSEIVILGFLCGNAGISSSNPVMELVPQPIFVLSTEGNVYAVIHGTKQGRILLGSADGFVHEVEYQAGRGWFKDRCFTKNLTGPGWIQSFLPYKYFTSSPSADAILQIVADNVRNLVFTRSSSGALQAFDLVDGTDFKKLGYISYEGIVNSVLSVSRKTLESTFTKKILCIAPIENGELNLVAITDSGTRLYFSCYNPPNQTVKYPNARPTSFNLVHIRLPPGYCTTTSMKKPAIAQNAFYSNGVFSLSSHVNQDQDCLWLITPFMYPSICYAEVSSIHTLPGVALDMKGIPCRDNFGDKPSQNVPDVVTQHLQWQREVVVLTQHGTIVYRAFKPYELLRDLLKERLGPDHIKGHYELGISREQPLANTVLLAIHPYSRLDSHIYDAAVKAFFMYGANSLPNQGLSTSNYYDGARTGGPAGVYDTTLDFNPNMVSTPSREPPRQMTSPVQDAPGYPSPPVAGPPSYGVQLQQQSYQQQQQQLLYQQQQDVVNFNFSARHDAMYLVVARILAPFWNRPLVRTGFIEGPNSPQIIISNIAPEEIAYAITFLQSMHKFIINNPSLYMSSTRHNSISMATMNANRSGVVTPQEVEKNAIAALKNILSLILEVFGMWKILCDHQFHIVLHGMEKHIENATMKEMVVTQHNVVSLIINALILKYLGDNAAVDAISLRLREVCPTLFRSEDAIGSKVAEMLAKVKNTTDHHEREALLKESLNLCEQICGHGRVNFRKFCQDYAELGYPSGFVRLCVTAAKAADPDQLAVAPLKSGAPSSDPCVEHAFQSRAEIYNIAFEILDNYTKLSTAKQSPLAKSTEETIPASTAQKYADETIQAILNCEDEVFHIGLYNWLVERKLFDRLLQIKHPYLDSFVQVTADAVMTGKWSTGVPTDTGILDLLWRHHEKNQNHMAAAQILAKLSESTTTGLNLQQRLEYISRAIICAKSCYRRGDLLEHLEDKGDVARIQKFILDLIVSKFNSFSSPVDSESASAEYKSYQDAIPKLNQQLYNITTLYTDFVEPFKLYEAKLDIFFSAGHGDKAAIETVWSDIVETELNTNLGQTMESQMEIIRRKLVGLGRKYITSPVFFPMEYLVEHLEAMKPTDTEHVGWVVRTMLEIGVTFSELLTIYDKLWKTLTNNQQSGGAEVQIAKVIMFMIEMFTKEDSEIRLSSIYRPEMLEECKNLTAAMIVEFSSRFDTTSTQMTHQLNRVKEGLDRCRF